MSTEPYYYLASPYSKYPDGIHAAFTDVCVVAAALIGAGIRVYSPIAHTHPIAIHGGIDPYDHKIWLPVDAPFMHNACGLIVAQMPTWDISYGIGVEIKEFTAANKPVIYLAWPIDGRVISALLESMQRNAA